MSADPASPEIWTVIGGEISQAALQALAALLVDAVEGDERKELQGDENDGAGK